MNRKKDKRSPFVGLSRNMLKSKEWRQDLRPAEREIYILIKYKFTGSNNGEIMLYYSEIEDMYSSATISKALKGLESKGWIKRTRCGGLYRFKNEYELTGKHDDWIR